MAVRVRRPVARLIVPGSSRLCWVCTAPLGNPGGPAGVGDGRGLQRVDGDVDGRGRRGARSAPSHSSEAWAGSTTTVRRRSGSSGRCGGDLAHHLAAAEEQACLRRRAACTPSPGAASGRFIPTQIAPAFIGAEEGDDDGGVVRQRRGHPGRRAHAQTGAGHRAPRGCSARRARRRVAAGAADEHGALRVAGPQRVEQAGDRARTAGSRGGDAAGMSPWSSRSITGGCPLPPSRSLPRLRSACFHSGILSRSGRKPAAEVREALARWIEATWHPTMALRDWCATLADSGYAFPTWPDGLGGRGWSPAASREVTAASSRRR